MVQARGDHPRLRLVATKFLEVLGVADELGQHRDDATHVAVLIAAPRVLREASHAVDRDGFGWAGTEQGRGQATVAHERVADRRDVVVLRVCVLDQDRLSEQVPDGHAQLARQFGQDVQASHVPLVALDLAEPVLGAADELGQHLLRQAAASAVERDAVAHAVVIAGASHGVRVGPPTDPRGAASAYPDSLSGSSPPSAS